MKGKSRNACSMGSYKLYTLYYILYTIKSAKEKNFFRMRVVLKIFVFLQPLLSDGALAQLARAFDWQSRGREFDSHTLHKKAPEIRCFFLCSPTPSLLQKKEDFLPNSQSIPGYRLSTIEHSPGFLDGVSFVETQNFASLQVFIMHT